MLRTHEPPPFEVLRPHAGGRLLLICDHASRRVPEALGSLGLTDAQLASHVGWDPGAAEVTRRLSELLDATAVLAGYSRLVIDNNRPVRVPSAMPAVSCGVRVPGNEGLDDAARAERIAALFAPYHAAIAGELERRGPSAVLLSIHSFTPEPLTGTPRPWPVSMLYGRDARLAHAFLAALRGEGFHVGDNEPYRVGDETDWSIPEHGERRGILHTAFELRQDGVATRADAYAWAERLARIWQQLEPSFSA